VKKPILDLFESLPGPAQNLVAAHILREAILVVTSDAAREPMTGPGLKPCPRPPAGWRCKRPEGHDGPCAALPIPGLGTRLQDLRKAEDQLAETPTRAVPTYQVWIVGLEDDGRDVAALLRQYGGYTAPQADRLVLDVGSNSGGPVAVYTTPDHADAQKVLGALAAAGARVEIRPV